MGKGAPLRWIENRYLRRYLHGKGIEIGALWRKFRVPSGVQVWYLDRLSAEQLARHYSDLHQGIVAPDIVGDAECLPMRAGSLDFIIASHVLEHLRFPLRALQSWYETLSPGGVLLLKVPDKRFTFDRRRTRTSLHHLIEESGNPAGFDVGAHYADWVQHVNDRRPGQPDFERDVQCLMEMNYSIHYHVWTDNDLKEIIEYTRRSCHMQWTPVVFWNAHFYRKEVIAVIRKE